MERFEPRELLLKIKEYDFIYDSKLGRAVNKNHEEDKQYVFKLLDLLYENFERVKLVDDLSPSVIGKKRWALLFSQKFAIADKRLPIPQVPFHIRYDGKDDLGLKSKYAYLMMIGFFQETEEDVYVSLNFKDEIYRKQFKEVCLDKELKR